MNSGLCGMAEIGIHKGLEIKTKGNAYSCYSRNTVNKSCFIVPGTGYVDIDVFPMLKNSVRPVFAVE